MSWFAFYGLAAENNNNYNSHLTLAEQLRSITEKRIELVLKEAETNFRRSIEAHIRYHSFLEHEAVKHKNDIQAGYHSLRRQVYQQILDNVSLAGSYNRT